MGLLSWLYSKREELELEFATGDWPEKAGLKLYDYETIVRYKNTELIGRGVDQAESVSILKSVYELIERIICHDLNISSVGLSIQSSVDSIYDADLHAQNEVLERHYLKKHVDQGIQFLNIDVNTPLVRDFKKHNSSCEVRFFKIMTPKDYFGVGCLLNAEDRSSIGFSCSFNELKSIDKSLIEALPNFYWLGENRVKDEEKPWHLKREFLSKINELCEKSTEWGLSIDSIPDFDVEKIDLSNHSLLSTAPIRATIYRIKNESK